MVAPLVWWAGGGVLALLTGLRVRKVILNEKAAAAAGGAAGTAAVQQPGVPQAPAPAPPAAVAAVTPAQVQAAAASVGMTTAQLSAAAQAAGTTPQALIASAQQSGDAVADALIAQAQAQAAGGGAQAAAVAQDPSLQAQINPASAGGAASPTPARVTTNDPAPAGDLAIRSAPDNNAPIVGGAEKDGIVFILEDLGNGFAHVSWPGGNRRPAVDGFAHTAPLNTNFNGEGFVDASEMHGNDWGTGPK